MGYRVIEPENIDIYEDPKKPTEIKKRFSLDDINISTADMYQYLIRGGIGLAMIWFGVSNAGSYYTSGTRLSGALGTLFYSMQVGTILIVLGILVLYHTFLGSGKKWI